MNTLADAVLCAAPGDRVSLLDAVLGPRAPSRTFADLVFREDDEHPDPEHATNQTPAAVQRALTRLAHTDLRRGDPIPRALHFALGVVRRHFDRAIADAAESAGRRVGATDTDEIVSRVSDPYLLIDLARRVIAQHAAAPPEHAVAHANALLRHSAHQRAIELRRAATAAKRGGLQRTPLSLDQPVGASERPAGETVGADLRHAHSERGPGGRYTPSEIATQIADQVVTHHVRASPQEKMFLRAYVAGMLSGDPDVPKEVYRREVGAGSSRVATTALEKLRAQYTPAAFAALLHSAGLDEARRITAALVECMLAVTPDSLVLE